MQGLPAPAAAGLFWEVTMPAAPQSGDFVRVRTRRLLVEDERSAGDGLPIG
jgi:hypothetical protein